VTPVALFVGGYAEEKWIFSFFASSNYIILEINKHLKEKLLVNV
jgi:hypothetical protein